MLDALLPVIASYGWIIWSVSKEICHLQWKARNAGDDMRVISASCRSILQNPSLPFCSEVAGFLDYTQQQRLVGLRST
jgi:hypothetical protein